MFGNVRVNMPLDILTTWVAFVTVAAAKEQEKLLVSLYNSILPFKIMKFMTLFSL